MPRPLIDRTTGERVHAFGIPLAASGAPVNLAILPTSTAEDYGADPVGDGTFRMVPSGDIVDLAERRRRLARYK
jgi:hypothetical protein